MKRFAFISARVGPGLAASIGLGWLATRGLDWGAVADSIRSISLGYLILSVLVFLFACYLRALRWQALFVNERISTNRLFIIQNAGIGLNNLVPIRIASEATQLAILYFRDRISGATALATLGMERVVDVVASTLILGIAFFLVPEMKNFTLYVWGAIGFTIVAVGLVRFLAWGSDSLALIRRIPAIASFARAVKELERERARLAVSLTMSILYWLLVGITTWIVAVALNLGISAMTATLVIMGTIFFATSVPAAPSAIGTFEFAVTWMLGFFGVEHEASFTFAVIIHAVLFLPPTIIAIVFLPREGVVSLRGIHKLEPPAVSQDA